MDPTIGSAAAAAAAAAEHRLLRRQIDRSMAPRFRRVVAAVLREGAASGDLLVRYPEDTAALIVAALTGLDEALGDGEAGPEWTPALVEFVHRVTGCTLSLKELAAEVLEVQPFTIG